MGKFTKVSQETFKELQLEAGLILNQFDPTGAKDVEDSHIICATTGGIEIACKPEFVDYAEDIDNVPSGMLEFKEIDSWACSIAFTALNASASVIKMALGGADVEGNKITPRFDLAEGDTSNIWWVGERADGGFVACCLKNALSTEGFTLKTTKKGKGQISCTLTGHVSITAQDEVPMEFYVQEGESA
jgi:hypothetical protein